MNRKERARREKMVEENARRVLSPRGLYALAIFRKLHEKDGLTWGDPKDKIEEALFWLSTCLDGFELVGGRLYPRRRRSAERPENGAEASK